jgi:RNA polymerase sigma-70 factor (ECF subfamily)
MKTMRNLAAEITDDDLGIARRIVEGDRAAFELLMRRHNRRLYAMTTHDDGAPDEALARSQVRALLERELDALAELFRVVFVLRSIEEMSVEETAQCLSIPEATVRSPHFRARSMLRESLAQALDLAQRDVFEFGGVQCDRIVANIPSKITGDAS